MSDYTSPNTVPDGVKRLNKTPIWIISAMVAIFAVIIGLTGWSKTNDRHIPYNGITGEGERVSNDTATTIARNLAGDLSIGGIIPHDKPQQEDGNMQLSLLDETTKNSLKKPETTMENKENEETLHKPLKPAPMNEEIRKLKRERYMQALQSGITVDFAKQSKTNPPPDNQIASVTTDPMDTYRSRLETIRRKLNGNRPVKPGSRRGTYDNDEYKRYAGNGDSRWKINSRIQAPNSLFELQSGFVIPATMLSGVNSDIQGQIMAQVSQHVYDSATGEHVLIPQGTRLVGTYNNEVAYGQSRVLVAWQRLVYPDGKTLDIGAMPGADSSGMSGFKDKVNTHMLKAFSSALLMSGITGGIAANQRSATRATEVADASSMLSASLGQQLGQVASQLLSKHMNVSPTIEVRPGYRFNVIVTKDLVFERPYKAFDYKKGE